MNMYLVRTKSDHVLMGIFCAESLTALAALIDEVFDARECEYLEMRANEGLFIEAKFVTVPGMAGELDKEILMHVDEQPEPDDESDLTQDAAADLIMQQGEDGYIPPVLEPTYHLFQRIQSAYQNGEWRPVTGGNKARMASARNASVEAPKRSAINVDAIARKLMEGGLNAATFMRASARVH